MAVTRLVNGVRTAKDNNFGQWLAVSFLYIIIDQFQPGTSRNWSTMFGDGL
jgi:hypothetical protein